MSLNDLNLSATTLAYLYPNSLVTLGDTYEGSGEDWNFIAHARTDVPALMSTAYDRLREHDPLPKEPSCTSPKSDNFHHDLPTKASDG